MATDTTPTPSIRALRHETRAHLAAVFVLLEGAPGMSKEERLERFEETLKHLHAAADHIAQAYAITAERNDEEHAAFKAIKASAILN